MSSCAPSGALSVTYRERKRLNLQGWSGACAHIVGGYFPSIWICIDASHIAEWRWKECKVFGKSCTPKVALVPNHSMLGQLGLAHVVSHHLTHSWTHLFTSLICLSIFPKAPFRPISSTTGYWILVIVITRCGQHQLRHFRGKDINYTYPLIITLPALGQARTRLQWAVGSCKLSRSYTRRVVVQSSVVTLLLLISLKFVWFICWW